jgi:hypothetical protein
VVIVATVRALKYNGGVAKADLGAENLRRAKLSYRPHHMVEKYWAYVQEAIHED